MDYTLRIMKLSTDEDISLEGSVIEVITRGNKQEGSADRSTAQVLALLDEFYEDIKLCRKEVGYTLVNRPSHNWFSNPEIDKWVDWLIKRYSLDLRWVGSLKNLIFLDYLTLPEDAVDVMINHLHPENKPGHQFTFTVTVNKKMTLKQLANQIIKNGTWINDYLSAIPESSDSNVQDNVMRWGSGLWLMRKFKDPKMTAAEYVALVQDMDAPDAATINTYYSRFIKVLDKHLPHK